MGSCAGVLRQSTVAYISVHRHIIVISVSRIPPVELEEASSTSSDDDYDYEPSEGAYEDDYDYQNELEFRRYLNGGADIRYRW